MSGWPSATLGECCGIISGATPSTSVAAYWGGDIDWATPKDLSELDGAYISATPRKVTRAGLESCAATVLPPQSVLFSSRAPIGHVATFKEVSKAIVSRIEIPLPPLAEQRRIADVLDRAEALLAKRRAALGQFDTLTQAIFLEMFGDPATNPMGWAVKRVDEIAECLDRLRRPVTESDRAHGAVPYYGANGQQGWIDSALFDEPLVLVAEDGGHFEAPERGVAYRIDGPAWVNNHAHILRGIPAHVTTEFLFRALRHFNFLPFISGTTRAKLTQGQLNSVKLFLPPLDLQQVFGSRIGAVERMRSAGGASLTELDAFFASLQHRAFRGEL
ncbi:MAG: restriction endonuclease subunit S [Gemmatimonadales bacterium]